MKIVTGYTGTPHVTSNDVQAFNQGIFGNGNYVLNVGERFAAELTNANTVSISDGEGVIQGVHFRIDPGTVDTVNISNGTTGYNRIDLICARYTKNAITGVEDVSLVVVEGTPTTDDAVAPDVNTGTILVGGSPVDFPLWEVDVAGLTPTIKALFTAKDTSIAAIDSVYTLKSLPVKSSDALNNSFSYCQLWIVPSIRLAVVDLTIAVNTLSGDDVKLVEHVPDGIFTVANDGILRFGRTVGEDGQTIGVKLTEKGIGSTGAHYLTYSYIYRELTDTYPLSAFLKIR